MKFLIDTNIFIPLELGAGGIAGASTDDAALFVRLASEGDHDVYLHPAMLADFERDPRADRRALSKTLLNKYRQLPFPPSPRVDAVQEFGNPSEESNDWVDLQNLAAVAGDAVDYLVTQDDRIHRRAERLGLSARVVRISDALAQLRGLQPDPPQPPPATQLVLAHAIPGDDPIFTSLRAAYADFEAWFQKCKRSHRPCFVIWGPRGEVAALAILKPNEDPQFGMTGRILKICTFKVSDRFRGYRYGELLLKALFQYAHSERYDWVFMTMYPDQSELIELCEDFGFDCWNERYQGVELVFRKPFELRGLDIVDLDPLEFHRRFGPPALRVLNVSSYVVPIEPRYHQLLFPDAEAQLALGAGHHPFGNAIKKAYLCRSNIRKIETGSNLLFYRSREGHAVSVIGVTENTLASGSADEIAKFVGSRTVYSLRQIAEMTASGKVLAILFRQAKILSDPITLAELRSNGVLRSWPQSITTVPATANRFLHRRLGGVVVRAA